MNESPPTVHTSTTTTTTTTTSAAAAAAATGGGGGGGTGQLVPHSLVAAASSTASSLSRRDAVLQLTLDTALFFWLLPKDVFMIVVRMLMCSTWCCLLFIYLFIYLHSIYDNSSLIVSVEMTQTSDV